MTAKLNPRMLLPLAAAAACTAAIAANAGAAQSASTLHLVAKNQRGVGFQPSRRPHQGSRIGFGERVSGDDTGYSRAVCTVMGKSAGVLCTLQLHLSKGTITAQGELPQRSDHTPVAITGGTGAYNGARGTATVTDLSQSKTDIRVALLP